MADDPMDEVVALARQRADELSALAGTEYEPLYAGNVAYLLTTLAAAYQSVREDSAARTHWSMVQGRAFPQCDGCP